MAGMGEVTEGRECVCVCLEQDLTGGEAEPQVVKWPVGEVGVGWGICK